MAVLSIIIYKYFSLAPASVAQLGEASSRTPKGPGFNSWSGHKSRLHVQLIIDNYQLIIGCLQGAN